MHNIDRKTMQRILRELNSEELLDQPARLLEQLRLAYEKAVLYQFYQQNNKTKDSSIPEDKIIDFAGEDMNRQEGDEIIIYDTANAVSGSKEEAPANDMASAAEDVVPEPEVPVENKTNPEDGKSEAGEEGTPEDEQGGSNSQTDVLENTGEPAEKKADEELTFEEKIKRILEHARQLESKIKKNPPNVSPVQEVKNNGKNQSGSSGQQDKKETEQEKQPGEISFEDEFKEAISADYAAEMFEKAQPKTDNPQSLNDKLSQNQLIIGLNDRIAFVKHLFAGDLFAFNQCLEHLQQVDSLDAAQDYIEKDIKAKYEWGEKQQPYEERFRQIIERKFGG